MEIVNSGDYSLLVKSGKVDLQQCSIEWENIVIKSCEVMGVNDHKDYFKARQRIERLKSESLIVNLLLLKMIYSPSMSVVNTLEERGYKIITSAGQKAFEDSLSRAISKCKNLQTKIKMYTNDLQRSFVGDPNQKTFTYLELLARLRMELAPTIIPDDISLALYNEYQKILKEQHRAIEKQKMKNGRVRR